MLSEILNDPAYNCLIVFDYDRFSRADEAIVYKLKLKKAGISLISVNQPMYPNNILAEQIENILLIIANIDNAMRRHKCYSGMVDCVRRGELYSRPPLGYDSHKEGKKHVITLNEKGHILSNAFEWVVNVGAWNINTLMERLSQEYRSQ